MQATVEAPRRKPVTGPIRPPKNRPDKKVFLEAELWARLADAAVFHEEVYALLGKDEATSRNDIIEWWLDWAEEQFWKDLGGRPTSKSDRAAKAEKYAAKLRADQEAKTAKK